MFAANLFDDQRQIFTCVLTDTQEQGENADVGGPGADHAVCGLRQTWQAQLKVRAANQGRRVATPDFGGHSFNGQAPKRVSGAVGKQNDGGGHALWQGSAVG
jgi:hypothetical protein